MSIGLVMIVAVAGWAMALLGQTAPGMSRTTPLPVPAASAPSSSGLQASAISPAAPDSYKIGPNDLLAITVFQMPDLSRQVRVSADGYIRLPLLPGTLPTGGITVEQLQTRIAAALVQAGIAHDPLVQAAVVQVESKPVVVAGAVNQPQTLQAARPMSLLEVLASAGGPSVDAGVTVLVSSRTPTGTTTASYALNSLLRNPNAPGNPTLTGNEMVTVLPAQMVFAVGAFRKPGAFPLHAGRPLTVVNAVAMAGGMDGSPDRNHANIIRNVNGQQRIITINISRILQHQQPDPRLQAGDILYVPEDRRHQVLVTALQDTSQILTLGAAYHFP